MNREFDQKKTIFLIDASTYLYRAYFSMKPIHTSAGKPVQAVYSFIRMTNKLIKMFKPKHMALVWDSKGKTERAEKFEEYKAGRQEPPTDLFEQKEKISEFAELIGLKQVSRTGVEADDIINSLTKDFVAEGFNVLIVASDKDLFQLLGPQVFIYDPFKDETFDKEKYETKRGFSVSQLPFYHALLGDSSDNIPGVKGIGKKGAEEIVVKFSSLKELYENLDKIEKPRTRSALEENRENAFLSLELFLLRYHTFNLKGKDVEYLHANWVKAKPLFIELEFKTLVDDLLKMEGKAAPAATAFFDEKGYKFKCVTKLEDLKSVCNQLKEKKEFAIDTETDGLRPLENKLVGLSVCAEKGTSYYIPFGHNIDEEQLSFEDVFKELQPILEDGSIKKYLHNVKFDRMVFHKNKIQLKGVAFDTMLAAGLSIKNWQRVGLKFLSQHYFNETMLTYDDVVKKAKLKDFSYVSLKPATNYAAADAHQTLALVEILQKELQQTNKELYSKMEEPLLDVLFDMELEGISVDIEMLKEIGQNLAEEIQSLETKIKDLTDIKEDFNLASPKQIKELLFDTLNLPTQKKSAKGTSYSTDSSVLEMLSELHPVPGLILKHRELTKLKSTYVDALPESVNPLTGKIHTTFSQIKTATGRLSSSSPNMQNIPLDSYRLRAAFKPNEGHQFLSADYSQIELRVLAYLTQEPNLIAAFEKNEDIHAITSEKLFNVPRDQVTTAQRQVGKRINFSIMYGLTPFGLSKDLKIPFKEAKLYIEKFFEQYPKVSDWMDKTVEKAKQTGYVETLWKRRRYVPEINERNKTKFDAARRMVINTPVQGTAADIMKIGMINLHKKLKAENLYQDAKIILQIHDELLLTVKEEFLKKISDITKQTMESVVIWNIPLIVSVKTGKNWQEVSK